MGAGFIESEGRKRWVRRLSVGFWANVFCDGNNYGLLGVGNRFGHIKIVKDA